MGSGDHSATGWVLVPTLGFAAVFAAEFVWFVIQLIRLPTTAEGTGPLPPVVELLLSLGMALGMGGSLIAMA